MQACFGILQQDATKQQSAPGSTASKDSPTVFQKPSAKESVAANKDMHLPQYENGSDCHMSYNTVGKTRKVRQTSTRSEISRVPQRATHDVQTSSMPAQRKRRRWQVHIQPAVTL